MDARKIIPYLLRKVVDSYYKLKLRAIIIPIRMNEDDRYSLS